MKLVMNNKGDKVKFSGLPVTWGNIDLFTHTLCIGATRCGKSALILQQIIMQTLIMKKKGIPIGLSVLEPKGDIARFTREVAEEMGLTDWVHVDPLREDSHHFNVMQGDMDIVAEATVTVLKGLFGKQEQFFALVQELSAKHVTKLLKTLAGDNIDIVDLVKTLRDEKRMMERVADLKKKNPSDELIEFFDNELLGENKERYRQFVMGLRAQLENLISNKKLRNVLSGRSDINLDEHYEKGGILAVNTGLAELGAAGDAFGQFVMMHLQRAAFRRKGTEATRIPHIMIVDEASRYINAEVEVFLAIGAEYRVAGIFALQSGGQLEVESGKIAGKAMRNAFLASCRNRIYFGGLAAEDAKAISEEIGSEKRIMRQNTYKNNILLPNLFPDSYRDTEVDEPIFSPTDLRYNIPKFHFVYQFQQDGQPMHPRLAKGEFVPRNWKEIRAWEGKKRKNIDGDFLLKPILKLKTTLETLKYRMYDKKETWDYERKVAKALAETTPVETDDWENIEDALKTYSEMNKEVFVESEEVETLESEEQTFARMDRQVEATSPVVEEVHENETYLESEDAYYETIEPSTVSEEEYEPPYKEDELKSEVNPSPSVEKGEVERKPRRKVEQKYGSPF